MKYYLDVWEKHCAAMKKAHDDLLDALARIERGAGGPMALPQTPPITAVVTGNFDGLVNRLDEAGAIGADLSPGDSLAKEAASVIRTFRNEPRREGKIVSNLIAALHAMYDGYPVRLCVKDHAGRNLMMKRAATISRAMGWDGTVSFNTCTGRIEAFGGSIQLELLND